MEANNALERVVSLIERSDGRWQYDDSNNTDLAIATTPLVANQQDYTLSISHLQITRAEYQDNSPTPQWHKLYPIDQQDAYSRAITPATSATYGAPYFYDKIGASIFLYTSTMGPAPNFSQAASLKLWFKRTPSYFLTSDTTKSPGFNALYHELIPLWIAYNYAIANGKKNGAAIMQKIVLLEDALADDYSVRDKDEHLGLRARTIEFN